MIEHLEEEARHALASDAIHGQRACVSAEVEGVRLEVFARRGHDREIRFGYSYGGVRLERRVLQTLTCSEGACPCRAAMQQRWKTHLGEAEPVKGQTLVKLSVRPLFEEVEMRVGADLYVARPASFECLTSCPTGAHGAIPMRKTGWDLFKKGRYVAGGLVNSPTRHALVPMLPTIDAAKHWLEAHAAQGVGDGVESRH